MGRYRSRSRSRSNSPTLRRKRYDDRRGNRSRSPAPTGLLVRNISLDARPEDLRIPFEKFGPVKDVYLPRNYYTGEPRGFGFVKFRHPEDAAEAKDRLNHTVIGGREIRIVYAEENRKTPHEMRRTTRVSGRYGGRRRTPPRSPRRRYCSYSRSPSSGRHHSRSVSRSPHSEHDHRSSRRSFSPREASPYDRRPKTRERSRSPRHASPSDEKGYKSRRSDSPREVSRHDESYMPSRRSLTPREISPLRASRTSASLRDESPCTVNRKSKQRTPSSREVSPFVEDYKSNRRSPSPMEFSRQADRRGTLRQKSPSQREISPVDEGGYRSKHRSPRTELNGGNLPRRKDSASRRSASPRRNGRSVSRSYSRSYSPR